MRALIDRGWSPVQAAALAGHIQQESSFNPATVNPREDSHGLIQWRLDRWDNLRKFASERGVSPSDPNLQLDFIRREMEGPEARNAAGFLAATDIPGASAALKRYIRWGDDSDQRRLNNALRIAGLPPAASGALPGAPAVAAASAARGSGSPAQSAPATPADTGLAALQAIPSMLAKQQQADMPAPLQLQPVEHQMTPAMVRARQLAQAMLSRSLNPEGET
jgi:hypothetical protein